MNKIGIFRGKQEKHNKQVLTLLYDNGPLTAWEITGKIQNYGKQSLHATLNKRLRDLEKKNYVQRGGKKWFLGFKGFIAVLMIQPKPKVWSTKWTQLIENTQEMWKNTLKQSLTQE
jgi:hypothetical protein